MRYKLNLVRFNNLILTKAIIDGFEGYLIVDSGAPNICLNKEFFNQDLESSLYKCLDAHGTLSTVETIKISLFEVGDLKMSDLELSVIELVNIQNAVESFKIAGILGLKGLTGFKVSIDYEKNEMILIDASEEINFNNYELINFELFEHLILIDVFIENRLYKFIFDTGSEITVLDSSLREELKESIIITSQEEVASANHTKLQVDYGTLKLLKINNYVYHNLKIVFLDIIESFKAINLVTKGVIGYEIISKREFIIDYEGRLLLIKK